MKKFYVFISLLIFANTAKSQSYDVLNYSLNGTPTHGVNIKTNIPFSNWSQMVTLKIEGYNYAMGTTISLNLVWYIFSDNFHSASISSAGGYTPEVILTNNNGLVNVYINDRIYYQRFKVTAFVHGLNEPSSWFEGWTTADEPIQGSNRLALSYTNLFRGTVINHGELFNMGNMGIGTSDPKGYKLAVAGSMIAESVKVKPQSLWPDYVFSKSYQLPTLPEIEKHIKEKGHLPGIPSATEVKTNGIDLGKMDAMLLKKIEELTLHLIEMKKQNDSFKIQLGEQQKEIQKLISKDNK